MTHLGRGEGVTDQYRCVGSGQAWVGLFRVLRNWAGPPSSRGHEFGDVGLVRILSLRNSLGRNAAVYGCVNIDWRDSISWRCLLLTSARERRTRSLSVPNYPRTPNEQHKAQGLIGAGEISRFV